jgi:crotonobetainyl-CoA:carnitine CoA-transferase CaiB-like acyl-CoA transferase
LLSSVLKEATVEEWCRRLEEADVPHAPILTVGQALSQEHVAVRGLVGTVHHPKVGDMSVVGPGLRIGPETEAWSTPPTAPPLLGQHTRSILTTLLGYSMDQIDEFVDRKVVAESDLSQDEVRSGPRGNDEA